jgi:uncharacterized membrane protein YeaQ/YmgE (transglycosylase-associated protein family)
MPSTQPLSTEVLYALAFMIVMGVIGWFVASGIIDSNKRRFQIAAAVLALTGAVLIFRWGHPL